jgi:hypothetical protein
VWTSACLVDFAATEGLATLFHGFAGAAEAVFTMGIIATATPAIANAAILRPRDGIVNSCSFRSTTTLGLPRHDRARMSLPPSVVGNDDRQHVCLALHV